MGKEEVRQRIRSTDVTDITDVRGKEEGRRKKEEWKNSYFCIRGFRVLNTGNCELESGNLYRPLTTLRNRVVAGQEPRSLSIGNWE
ncbi:hypothetical protein Q5691_06865 [Microcoleus sp. w1-18aA5]|uniref:hypothetical protein n=1 Tax=unclassified Microcoleus TaxID=2642155 RepID=UPI002FCEABE5